LINHDDKNNIRPHRAVHRVSEAVHRVSVSLLWTKIINSVFYFNVDNRTVLTMTTNIFDCIA